MCSYNPLEGWSNAQNPGLRHTVFLSHSGIDKDFVGILAEELEMRSYEPFFDEKSLQNGHRVSMDTILELAKTCKLGLIVLSNDFFSRTKNPMLELATFIKHGIPFLPLFFKLTVEDVENEDKRRSWMLKWTEWSATDARINIADWTSALNELTRITGPRYDRSVALSNYAKYARSVADEVCGLLPPDICPSDDHVQGKPRLCEEVKGMFANAPEVHGAKVLALWGMEGVGKSTLCTALRKFYHAEFAGRVCYVEFTRQKNQGRYLQLENIKTLCVRLTNANTHFVQKDITDVVTGIDYLDNHLPSSKKFLLILDNVHEHCVDEARKLFLDRRSNPQGSHLLFLGRCRNSLTKLLPNHTIHRFPDLNFEEAQKIFLSKTLFLYQNECDIERRQKKYDAQPKMQAIVNQCINLCKVSRASCSYNPKMLESLASCLPGCKTEKDLKKWGRSLSKLEKDRSEAMKGMFRLLQESYDALNPQEKALFLDLALYTLGGKDVRKLHFEQEPPSRHDDCLQNLTGISFCSENYDVLDVHRDFARDLVKRSGELFYVQGLNSITTTSLHSWLLNKVQNGLEKLAFVNCTFSLKDGRLDLPALPDQRNIRVLLLDSIEGLTSLNVGRNMLLRMEIKSTCKLQVEGEDSTVSLTVCTQDSRLPILDFRHLAILELQGIGSTPWNVDATCLGNCNSLKYVQLDNIDLTIDLSRWPHLEELKLSNLAQVTMLSGLQNLTALRKLAVVACNQLCELQLPGSLRYWDIKECEGLTKIHILLHFKYKVILELRGIGSTPWKVDAACLEECESLKYVQLDNIELTEAVCCRCLEELELSNLAQATRLSGLQNLTGIKKTRTSRMFEVLGY